MSTNFKITVLGAGSFGTAIAHVLCQNGVDVLLWARDAQLAREISEQGINPKYLPGQKLSGLSATTDLDLALHDRAVLISAIPAQHVRGFLAEHRERLPKEAVFVNLAKGIETESLKTPSDIFRDELGKNVIHRFATVSGPTFAKEMCAGMPTGAVVASFSDKTARLVQNLMSTKHFRLYRLTDVIGAELGGALKNVMAIGVGIADGLGLGHNTRAGLITRCLNEMTELGLAMGAKARTFSGLSGLGDLILTCTGDLSRNRQVGLRLGRGESMADIEKSLSHVVEGIPTAKSVYDLSCKLKIEMPNSEHVYKIIYEGLDPKQAVTELLTRDLKAEYEA